MRRDYGEPRWAILAEVEEVVFHITFTRRSKSVRLISVRRASCREREAYYR